MIFITARHNILYFSIDTKQILCYSVIQGNERYKDAMIIHGLQKLTLLDFPGKTACTVFTGGCNLRCPFCHNANLVLNPGSYPVIPEEEVFELLKKRKNTIDGICITGGEPMLMKDLPEFLSKLKELSVSIKIDTNGTFPRQLKYIVNERLCDSVAMDIKNSFERYPETVGRPDFDISPIKESIEFLKSCGIDHEFRTTVCKNFHTEDDLIKIAELLGKEEKYFLQSFKDSGELMSSGVTGYTPSEMQAILLAVKRFTPKAQLRGV